MAKTPRRSRPAPEARRRVILDAARRGLIEKGYHELQLDELAARAGVAKGTLYLYFKSKEDLVAAVLEDLLDSIEARLPPAGKTPPLEALTAVARENLAFVDEQRDFLAQVSQPSMCGRSSSRVRERFGRYVGRLASYFEAGVKTGALRRMDARLGAMLMMALSRSFLMRKLNTGSEEPLTERTPELVDLLLHGVGRRA